VVITRTFLGDDEPTILKTWDTTSDSIAARVATMLGAHELVLLKSSSIPSGATRDAAVRLGLVDPVFPNTSQFLERVSYVNLRDERSVSVALPREGDDTPDRERLDARREYS
jgi:hypothetical protein